MKTFFLSIILFLFSTAAYAQDWSAGIRLGDPSGITIKRYMGSNALELSLGRTHMFYGEGWYSNRFHNWYKNKNYGYYDYGYVAHNGSAPISLQLHFLVHKTLKEAADKGISGLDWYFGGGGQFRVQSYNYEFRYKPAAGSGWLFGNERVTNFDIGADGVLGLEYTFEQIPVSVFLDGTLFMEIIDNPFRFWFQAGTGARYRF